MQLCPNYDHFSSPINGKSAPLRALCLLWVLPAGGGRWRTVVNFSGRNPRVAGWLSLPFPSLHHKDTRSILLLPSLLHLLRLQSSKQLAMRHTSRLAHCLAYISSCASAFAASVSQQAFSHRSPALIVFVASNNVSLSIVHTSQTPV